MNIESSAFVVQDDNFAKNIVEGFNRTAEKITEEVRKKEEQLKVDKDSIEEALRSYKGRFFNASEEGAIELRDWYAEQIDNRVNPNSKKFREEFRSKFWEYQRQNQGLESLDKRVAEWISVADEDPYMRGNDLKKFFIGELGKKSLKDINIDAINNAIYDPKFNNIEAKLGAFVETLDFDMDLESRKTKMEGYTAFQRLKVRPQLGGFDNSGQFNFNEAGQEELIESILNGEENFFNKKDLVVINRLATDITKIKLEAGDDTSVRMEARKLIAKVFEKKAIEEYKDSFIRQEYRPRAETSTDIKKQNRVVARNILTQAFDQADTQGKVDDGLLSRWKNRGDIVNITFSPKRPIRGAIIPKGSNIKDIVVVTVERTVKDRYKGNITKQNHIVFDKSKQGEFNRLLDFLESRRNKDVKSADETTPSGNLIYNNDNDDNTFEWMKELNK